MQSQTMPPPPLDELPSASYNQDETFHGYRCTDTLLDDSFGGENVLGMCTPQGRSEQDKLPREPLLGLKLYLVCLFQQ